MPLATASLSYTIPASIGGWYAKDPLDMMEESSAIRLINMFPTTQGITLRKGFRVHSTGLGSGAVETLVEYADAAGNRKLIACANGNIYNATTYGGVASSLASGLTNNRWQCVNFRDSGGTSKLIMVNGADTPKQYDGSTVSNAAYTVIVTPANLIDVISYKNRLYFVEKDTTKVWYGSVDASTGALTAFDVGSLFKRGGYLNAITTWSRDTGAGSDDLLVLISSVGEMLVYSGDNPGATNWTLSGRFPVPSPLGRRCFGNMGGESVVLTDQGVIPFSSLLTVTDQTETTYVKLTDNISPAFISAAKDYSSVFGWQFVAYPRGSMAIVNVPVLASTQYQQAVVNTLTGAWCKFTNINSVSWCLLNEKPYFGGIDGKVYEFDSVTNDNGNTIPVDVKTAFSYCGDRDRLKKFVLGRPLVAVNGEIRFSFNIDTDFQERVLNDEVIVSGVSGSDWDTADWDTSDWDSGTVYNQNMYAVDGIGRCAAIRLKGNYKDISITVSAFHLVYEPGTFY